MILVPCITNITFMFAKEFKILYIYVYIYCTEKSDEHKTKSSLSIIEWHYIEWHFHTNYLQRIPKYSHKLICSLQFLHVNGKIGTL